MEASSRLGVVRMTVMSINDMTLTVINLTKQEATTKYAENYKIRVKIDGKFYVGHLELSE